MLSSLTNTPRDYAWGSNSLIAELQGRTPTKAPEAEVWFGDHPGSPAVLGDRRTLVQWAADTGAEKLPYLLKLLAAASPLSIQVHPSKAEAGRGFEREIAAGVAADAVHRNYKDDNHKPEVIVAVSDRFEALAGLRDIETSKRLLESLPDSSGVRALLDRLRRGDAEEALRSSLEWLLSGTADNEVASIIAALSSATSGEFDRELAVVGGIAEAYPGDAGVVVALLMNYVELRRGEAIFVPAGVLHAYLSGLGVEIMAASDNVLRGGLTPKHIDVGELMSIVRASPDAPPLLAPTRIASGVEVFRPGIADFELWHVDLAKAGEARIPLQGPAIALAVAGTVEVSAGEATVTLRPGEAAFASADERDVHISGAGEIFVAQPGS